MPDLAMLDYFYGDEAEQFTFYRIPKVLFTDPSYRRISSDAKILYGLMLDRMGLSVRNGWLDEYNRVFIFFTLEDALEYLCCGHTKAVSLFGELDKAGLIERKKQGQGKPTKIYVKNFVRNAEVLTSEKRKSKVPQSGSQDFQKTASNMLTVQNNIWQRTIVNRYAGKTTRIYLDEFHLLLKEPQTAAYTAEIYKRFRKWNGIPTSLTQNVKDLLESPEIENILENSDFILMLNQAASDRNILAQRLGISPQELGHITNSDAGEGLLFFGDKIIPFVDKFPTDTKLYQVMTTKPADLAA